MKEPVKDNKNTVEEQEVKKASWRKIQQNSKRSKNRKKKQLEKMVEAEVEDKLEKRNGWK